ncbi:MAG TPA: hypothetical protein VGK00_00225 [Anaerolineales bacterium]
MPTSQTPEPQTSSPPSNNGIQFFLTADKPPVQIARADGSTSDLQQGESAPLSENDAITVGGGGLGKLLYSDRINIEILQNTQVTLSRTTEVTGGRVEATLLLASGHVHIRTGETSKADVILKTDDSTITTLVDETDFTVCYAPGPDGLTCHPVIRGSIKVFGKDGTQVYDGPSGGYTFNGQSPQPPVCLKEDEYKDWLARMRNGEDVPALGALVDQWYKTPCDSPPAATDEPQMETPIGPTEPTETPEPATVFEPPSLPYVRIISINIDDQQHYVVEYETFGYTEQLPGQHVHFFFNTVPPEQAGVPGSGPWYLYGGPRPFTRYSVSQRPADATQMCALVANSNHSVQQNTGNCVDLP